MRCFFLSCTLDSQRAKLTVTANPSRKNLKTPAHCPVCGTAVPAHAKACPECGADERSGWSEEATRYDGLDLPDSAFADDATPPRRARGETPSVFWWVVAVGLLLLLTLGLVWR